MSVKVYLAQAMTGLSGNEIWKRLETARQIFLENGIEILSPVIEEGIKPQIKKVSASREDLINFWKRDKELIRKANVIVDLTPEKKSEGVAHEIGYARYFLWKPIVRVYDICSAPSSSSSVAYFEDDLLITGLPYAALWIKEKWGSRYKRFIWRIKLYNRCYIKGLYYKLLEWF